MGAWASMLSCDRRWGESGGEVKGEGEGGGPAGHGGVLDPSVKW